MISRSGLTRNALCTIQKQCRRAPSNRRSLAAAASGSFQYQTGDSNGVKFASRDLPGPTTTLAVIAKAGTRYQPLPGYTGALEHFAFMSTEKRSTLRIAREVELLGGQTHAYHTREGLVLQCKFLRDDLPYFTELLGEVISQTKYTAYELHEDILRIMNSDRKKLLSDPTSMAMNSAHGVAFHNGLGTPLYPTSSTPMTKYLDEESVAGFSTAAYAKTNFAVVANGAAQADLSKWVGEFFTETPTGNPRFSITASPTKYYGGEERIAHDSGNAMVIAFPGSSSFTSGSSYKPEMSVLAALLGGESSIKWSPGFSLLAKAADAYQHASVATQNNAYSDAGLLTIAITGNADHVAKGSKSVVDTIKKVAAGEVNSEDIKKAVALARFRALEAGQNLNTGLEATGLGLISSGKAFQMDEIATGIDKVGDAQVKAAAKTLLDAKATVSAVGDLFRLPYADDIGLQV